MPSPNPLVSYIVVTHKWRESLKNCLQSIDRQDCQNKQIILVVNQSDGGVVSRLGNEFPHLECFEVDDDYGAAGGRNFGFHKAKGEYVIFLDDDAEFVDDGATRLTLELFKKNSKIACVGYKIINAFSKIEEVQAIPRLDKKRISDDYQCSYFCGASFAIRAGIFKEIGLFWEPLNYLGEELDLSYRIIDHGHIIWRASSIRILHCRVVDNPYHGRRIYNATRNRPWIATRNLPAIYVLTTWILSWSYLLMTSMRLGKFTLFCKGMRDSLLGLPKSLQSRQKVSCKTIEEIKRLSGRCWY